MPTTLLNPDIQAFIKQHARADVSDLALQKMPDSWPRADILNQIRSRQKAQKKIPSWLETDPTIILPPPDLIEQASSIATATYKASLFSGTDFVDLTGGVGVDCAAFSQKFDHITCIEHNRGAADLLRHNLPLVTHREIAVVQGDACTYVNNMLKPVDLVYIDPQRRDDQRKGLKYFEECRPNILNLLPTLMDQAQNVLIKTSPMLDIHQTLKQLPQTRTVYVIEWKKECREVLYHLTPDGHDIEAEICAVSLDDNGTSSHKLCFTYAVEKTVRSEYAQPQTYLYEPGPAFLKAGCYEYLASRYDVEKLHPHTHLYTSDAVIQNFPGKSFEILGLYPVRKKLLPVSQAHLALRNFPGDVKTLYKQLNLKAGGDDMVFACTCLDEKKPSFMRDFCRPCNHGKMIMMIRFVYTLMFLLSCTFAHAQDSDILRIGVPDTLSNANYIEVVTDAIERDPYTDFGYMRYLYTRMAFYEPETDLLLEQLFAKANSIKTFKSQNGLDAYQKAVEDYSEFITMHMAHSDIMWGASILAAENPIFGSSDLYLKTYQALRRSLLGSGDGKTPESAYKILTWGEEKILLAALGLQSIETEAVSSDIARYNIHRVYNPKTDKSFILFINTTFPMHVREQRRREEMPLADVPVFSNEPLRGDPAAARR